MLETINGKYTIEQIFKDNWDWFLEKHQTDIRPVVIENVEKILACGDKDKMGYSLYQCPDCGQKKFVAHTCKSRFCNSCGKVMTDNWIRKAQAEFLNVFYYIYQNLFILKKEMFVFLLL